MSHTLTYTGFNKKETGNLSKEYVPNFGDIPGHLYDLFLICINYLKHGKTPVYVFIIISGFVITHLLRNKKESYPVYITRRFFRLWPALMFTLIIALLFREIGEPFRGKHSDPSFWTYFFAEASMLHGLIPNQVLQNGAAGITGVGWSISLEWQFYIIAPFLLTALTVKGWRIYVVITALIIFAFLGILNDRTLIWGADKFTWNHPGALPHMIGFFFLGIVSHYALGAAKEFKNSSSALIITVMLMAYNFQGPEGALLPIMIWALMYMTIISSGSVINKITTWRPLRWLGDISYSTYICHIFVIAFVEAKIVRKYGFGEPDTFEKLGYLILFSWPLIIVISMISFYFVEKPGIAFGKNIAKRLQSRSVAA